MPFADDLLEDAYHLAARGGETQKQASLRRAVSNAYYALFHLLIDDAIGNWAVERQRGDLARTFDHFTMKGVCDEVVNRVKSGGNLPAELNTVARIFLQLRQHRTEADYNISKTWTSVHVYEVLTLATEAFGAWRTIRSHADAQDYLLDLFLPKRQKRL